MKLTKKQNCDWESFVIISTATSFIFCLTSAFLVLKLLGDGYFFGGIIGGYIMSVVGLIVSYFIFNKIEDTKI